MSKDNKVSHEQITKNMDMLTAMTALGAAEAEVYGQSGYKAVIVEPKK